MPHREALLLPPLLVGALHDSSTSMPVSHATNLIFHLKAKRLYQCVKDSYSGVTFVSQIPSWSKPKRADVYLLEYVHIYSISPIIQGRRQYYDLLQNDTYFKAKNSLR